MVAATRRAVWLAVGIGGGVLVPTAAVAVSSTNAGQCCDSAARGRAVHGGGLVRIVGAAAKVAAEAGGGGGVGEADGAP